MPVQWIDRTTRGPAKEFLDRAELRAHLDIPDELLSQFISAGILPEPNRLTKRTVRFTWEHATMLAIWMKLGGRISGTETPPEVNLPSPDPDQP